MRKLIEKNEFIILTAVFMLIIMFMFFITIAINGPFTFGDESEYHKLASSIFYYHKFYLHEYNPLYPLLIAPTFYFNNLIMQFYAIKLINITVYASIIFPVYLIGNALFSNKPLAILVAFIATLGPISAYSHLVWAEPLYYTLICWSYYFIVRYLTREKTKDIFFAGVFIGLSFLTKQAALFLLISYYIYVAYAAFRGIRKLDKKAIGLISVGASLFVLPWIIRNNFVEQKSIGYSNLFSLLFSALKNNPLQFITEFPSDIGYSIGYWIFVYFGGGFFLLLFAAFKSDMGNKNDIGAVSSFAKIILLQSMLLMLTSELFYVGYGVIGTANGRYVDVIYPVAIIVIVWAAFRLKQISREVIVGLALMCFILLLLFSPLTQLEAHAIVHDSGVSILNYFWPNRFIWDKFNPTFFEKLILATTLTALLVFMLVVRKNAIWIICLSGLLLGITAQLQVVRLGTTANPTNTLFLELEKQHIPIDKVKIDSELQKTSIAYHMEFWHPTTFPAGSFLATKFVDPITLMRIISIDFGQEENKAGNDELKIWAPWNPESGFNKIYGSGFSDISTLNGGKCPDLPKQGDFVFDHKPLDFKFFLPTGKYILRGKSVDTRCLGIESNFFVQAQGAVGVKVHGNVEFVLPFEVGSREQWLKMSLKPANHSVWALDSITIEAQSKKFSQGNKPQYLISTRLLPFPQVLNVSDYRLYNLALDEKVRVKE
ncbi:MAG: ArnT family glycosyltransferase [Leptospirales bacterium]